MKTNSNSTINKSTLSSNKAIGIFQYTKDILKQIRCHQWVKNVFLFIPAFFAGNLFLGGNIYVLLLGFMAFSLGASTIYIINDLADVEKDRVHPTKKHRPIASGSISVMSARVMAVTTLMLCVGLCLFLPYAFGLVVAAYLVMNFCYCFGLKHVAFLDIIIIACGFFLRILAGGFLVQVPVSSWLMLITFLLALFLAFGKRRDDVIIFMEEGKKMRKSITGYNLTFIDASLGVLIAVTIVCYIMYTLSPEVTQRIGSEYICLTALPVIIGVLRYLQLTFVFQMSGSPTDLVMKDTFLQVVIGVWLVLFSYFLYLT